MTVKIFKDALNLREELASLRNQGGLPKEDKLYVDSLVTNGNFGTNSGWTLGANWEISNGQLHANSTAAYTNASQTLNTTAGKTYKATVTCTSHTAGTFRLYVHDGGGYEEYVQFNTTGTYSVTWKAHTNSDQIRVYGFGGSLGEASFDNLSVQEVGENLVTNGTFDYDGGWNQIDSGATISNGVLNLDGTPNADVCRQDIDVVAGKTYHLSWEIKSISGGTSPEIGLKLGNSTVHTASTVGVHTATAVATSTGNIQVYVTGNPVGTVDNVIVTEGSHQVIQSIPHGYDVKDVYIDGELAREGEGYDYEVKTDGINQWLKPTVEPTATTETVVIGVRK